MFEVVAETNRYFANAEPWKLNKTDPARMRLVLYVTIETLRIAATLLQPIMPGSMGSSSTSRRPGRSANLRRARGRRGRRPALTRRIGSQPGRALPAPSAVFPRYVEPEASAP